MARYYYWTVHLLVILNLLICLEAKSKEFQTSEIDRLRMKRQYFGFSFGPFDWFSGGGYRRNFGFGRFLHQRPVIVKRFWRRRFGRFGDRWWH